MSCAVRSSTFFVFLSFFGGFGRSKSVWELQVLFSCVQEEINFLSRHINFIDSGTATGKALPGGLSFGSEMAMTHFKSWLH